MEQQNIPDMPMEWHALGREASLVRHLAGSGAVALEKANFANKGEYYVAFFGLSIGIERLAKLVLVADYAISNGNMPKQKMVRKFGHELLKLADKVEKISKERNLNINYARPNTEICIKILECLNAFADANSGRYANLASLGDPNLTTEEPIKKWWGSVAEAILQQHYRGRREQKKQETIAKSLGAAISSSSEVMFTGEDGNPIRDGESMLTQAAHNKVAQKYGKFYALTIIRWLSEVLSELGHLACYQHKIDGFFGIHEHFAPFNVPDKCLKGFRKTWL